MATTSDWSATALCTYTDVTARYARVDDLTDPTSGQTAQQQVEAYAAKAKDHIGRLLDVVLRERREEITLADLADLKDAIGDLTVFKEGCVAWTLKLLFEDNSIREDDYNDKKMRDFQTEFKREYQIALQLMTLDIDQSADISDAEALAGPAGNRFMRV